MNRQTIAPFGIGKNRTVCHCKRARDPKVNKVSVLVTLVAIAIWLSGCSTVDPKPFTAFNTLAKELTKTNEAAQTHFDTEKNYWMSRNGGNRKEVARLFLKITDDQDNGRYTYSFSFNNEAEPVFIKWRRFQAGLSELNLAFIRYTELLAELAGSDLISQEDFDKLAKDLNNNVRNALLAINPPKPGQSGPDAKKVGLFSTLATKAAEAYIQSKRKEHLVKIINENQKSVEAILTHGVDGISVMTGNVRAVYEFNVNNIKSKLANSSPEESRILAESIYADSLVVATTVDLLNSLIDTYESLSVTHRSLSVGIDKGQFSVSSLVTSISRVQKLYKELEKANEEAEKKRKEAEKS